MDNMTFEQAEQLLTAAQKDRIARCLWEELKLPQELNEVEKAFAFGLYTFVQYEDKGALRSYFMPEAGPAEPEQPAPAPAPQPRPEPAPQPEPAPKPQPDPASGSAEELQGQIAAKVSELVGLGVAKDAIGVAVKNACGTANYKKVEDAGLLGAVLTALNVLGGEA